MKAFIPVLAAGLALAIGAPARAACHVADSTVGVVQATVIGLEVQAGCTYVLVKDIQTTLPAIDTNPFAAGRYPYLSLDPAHAMYKPFLALATVALQTGQRVHANVLSRTAVVSTLSIVTEASGL